jgi:hypothetical protein
MSHEYLPKVPLSVGGHPLPLGRRQKVVHCVGQVECGDFVAVTGKDAIDGQAPDAERENRIGL